MISSSLQTKSEAILSLLNSNYPHTLEDMNFLKFQNPFEILIMTILSAQTTDKIINRLHDELFNTYPTPEKMALADPTRIEQIIKPAGYYHSKSRNIIATAQKLVDNFNATVPETIEELITLPGVGRKTANIVTSHAFHKIYGIAVDTHVKRLSLRLGLSLQQEPEKIELDLLNLIDRKWWGHVNYLLISHGRTVCTAKKPLCSQCCIKEFCTFHD